MSLSKSILPPEHIAGIEAALNTIADIPGDLAELGVYQGGLSHMLAKRCPSRIVRLFDTFKGIPQEGHDPAKDRHQPGEFSCTLDEVRLLLSDCPNVTFHPGVFPETAAGDQFALVHLDADLYASTLAGLEYFWPRLSVGGAIVLDDWKWDPCPGVVMAVGEYFDGRTDNRQIETGRNQLTVYKR